MRFLLLPLLTLTILLMYTFFFSLSFLFAIPFYPKLSNDQSLVNSIALFPPRLLCSYLFRFPSKLLSVSFLKVLDFFPHTHCVSCDEFFQSIVQRDRKLHFEDYGFLWFIEVILVLEINRGSFNDPLLLLSFGSVSRISDCYRPSHHVRFYLLPCLVMSHLFEISYEQ